MSSKEGYVSPWNTSDEDIERSAIKQLAMYSERSAKNVYKKQWLFLVLCSFYSYWLHATPSSLSPVQLTTEYLKEPMGIDVTQPRLGWILTSSERSQLQYAYEIVVADNLKDIQLLKGNMWQTGKINSRESQHIEYNGQPLQSFTRYYWRVKVYDANDRASGWSAPSFFATAALSAGDWKAKWISDGSPRFEKDEDFYRDDPMPLFRKEFSTTKKIASASLYVSGMGYYEAYLNGKKIGDHVLDPGFTTYRKQVQYATYDLTASIRPGKNVMGFMSGNGWWNPLPLRLFGRFNLRSVQQTGRPCVKAQLYVKYADGSSEIIITDESWQTASGPVIRNNVYLGERYDARLEKENWNAAGFSGGDWKKASIAEGPSGKLTSQMQPPIRITRTLRPVSIKEVGKDTFIVDMGQNFAGVARIKVKGGRGVKISLRYGEDTFSNGRLNYLTTVAGQIKEMWRVNGGAGAPKTAWQQDEYILKGNGMETWWPRFTFHGFRYIEITGWPGAPSRGDIEGLRMNSDLEENGSFSCSNEMFNRLQEAIQWTFLSNVFSLQSDCPGREKMGYGADIVVTANAFMYNYNMCRFYAKTVQDFANEQQTDGGITETAPYTGIADKGYGGASGPLGWQLAYPYLQKQLYEFYGDNRIIAQQYEGVQKQIEFLRSKAINGLFYWDISDHEAIDPKPEAFSASAFYYHHVSLAADLAGILNKKEDSIQYAKLALNIRNSIVRHYMVPKTGRFDNATQSAQLFALWYGFSPEEKLSLKVLMEEFARHNWHVSTGIFSTKMMFDVLRENGENETAYRITDQRDFPGWGYMLSKGATTLWETWAYPDNAPSQNHPMFGSVSEWFYRSLLGINPAAAGFKKILLTPQPLKDLSWAKGNYQSLYGNIRSEWKKADRFFEYRISIPANTTAEVWIPAKENSSVTENNKPLQQTEAVQLLRYEKDCAVLLVGSGEYNFRTEL